MTNTFTDPAALPHDELELGATFAPRFNTDGLIMAIATDSRDGTVLMAAWMNAEALRQTLMSGEVHYFSRSRGKLWKKGETSGEIQKLVELRTDCDQDVILMTVEQTGRGAACHTGHRSCFFRRVDTGNDGFRLVRDAAGPLFDPAEVYSAG